MTQAALQDRLEDIKPGGRFKITLRRAIDRLLSQQRPDGIWCYTLEANESIGAGFIQLLHFLGEQDPKVERGLARRLLSQQQPDGSWPIFFGGPGDLSVTVECYLALRLAGYEPEARPLRRAREFVQTHGGPAGVRVFTRIHLALFGLLPWSCCPSMPSWFIFLPAGLRVSIYEFSSWARASIVPLLVILDRRPVVPLPFSLDELTPPGVRGRPSSFAWDPKIISWKNLFLLLDHLFRWLAHLPWHPTREQALERCLTWIREHIERTEDIYPAMAYAAMAMKAAGRPLSDPTLRKAVEGLRRFQQQEGDEIHQQCCISPVWDTPWAGVALIEAGVEPGHPALLRAARTVLEKEIRDFKGDWRFKNPRGPAGGWSFEFQNDYFPDVDDTIEVLLFLKKVGLPAAETEGAIGRGLSWLLSMQSTNGGWAAFDKDNRAAWVNRIPFSDHGACLDPPTSDVTGRMLELLALCGRTWNHPEVGRAIRFIQKSQEKWGPWRGRWGVNYIYGTWCVLQGLAPLGADLHDYRLAKAVGWLKSIQNGDGGWGESCLSDRQNRYVPLGTSVPSQTAWALLGLTAGGESDSPTVDRGIRWLLDNQQTDGSWEEPYFTGTGFPGHFYLRYHGYAAYFPLLALARLQNVRPDASPS